MRISTNKDDSGYAMNYHGIHVFLNGERMVYAIAADDEEGFVEVYQRKDGQFIVEDDVALTEKLYGDVRIEVPPGWVRIT